MFAVFLCRVASAGSSFFGFLEFPWVSVLATLAAKAPRRFRSGLVACEGSTHITEFEYRYLYLNAAMCVEPSDALGIFGAFAAGDVKTKSTGENMTKPRKH